MDLTDPTLHVWDLMAKVCDFGLSMKVDLTHGHVSNMKQGTPFYVAPEVHEAGHLSMAADVHSFGAYFDPEKLFSDNEMKYLLG